MLQHERRRTELGEQLAALEDPEQIGAMLTDHQDVLPDDASRDAWIAFARSGLIEPTYEIATVTAMCHSTIFGRSSFDPGRRWREISRTDAWHAGPVVLHDDQRFEIWLDHDGTMWRAVSCLELNYLPGKWSRQTGPTWVALFKGTPFAVSDCPQSFGPLLFPNATSRSLISGTAVDRADGRGLSYARVIAAVIKTAQESPGQ